VLQDNIPQRLRYHAHPVKQNGTGWLVDHPAPSNSMSTKPGVTRTLSEAGQFIVISRMAMRPRHLPVSACYQYRPFLAAGQGFLSGFLQIILARPS
jgi:hypothetical protein